MDAAVPDPTGTHRGAERGARAKEEGARRPDTRPPARAAASIASPYCARAQGLQSRCPARRWRRLATRPGQPYGTYQDAAARGCEVPARWGRGGTRNARWLLRAGEVGESRSADLVQSPRPDPTLLSRASVQDEKGGAWVEGTCFWQVTLVSVTVA